MPSRRCLRAVAVSIGLVLTVGGRPATADTDPVLRIQVRNAAKLAERTVREALMIAGGVYRRAGVSIQWNESAEVESTDRRFGRRFC